jgi:DNA-binding LacI/PurR family transcriptional regulator
MADILDAAGEPPTAVYAHSDELAFGVLHTLRRRGYRVPEDISVVGIDNHPLAELLDLTTVAQDVGEQGAAAARLVLQALGRGQPEPGAGPGVVAPVRLIERASTAPPRA